MIEIVREYISFMLNKWQQRNFPSIEKRYSLRTYQVYPVGRKIEDLFLIRGKQAPFFISSKTSLASIGSCFAREIKNEILQRKYTYVQTEFNKWSRHSSCAWERVYTTALAAQIAEYSFSQNFDRERIFEYEGKWFDVFRHNVYYNSLQDANNDIESHLKASRLAFEKAQVMILTVGQNENWVGLNGLYYAKKPANTNNAKLTQGSIEDNLKELNKFYSYFRKMNKTGMLILTLSPVPSLATFFDTNVVIRSMLNKSILRLAIEEFVQNKPDAFYFPSFEIVYSMKGGAFKADNRHVSRKAVRLIMDSFFSYFSENKTPLAIS